MENVNPSRDLLMLAAVQLQEIDGVCYPVIIDIGVFPMLDCIRARDNRLTNGGGRWHNGVPQVVKRSSMRRYQQGLPLTDDDFEKDTNFGKLKRIPYLPLQDFMRMHGAI